MSTTERVLGPDESGPHPRTVDEVLFRILTRLSAGFVRRYDDKNGCPFAWGTKGKEAHAPFSSLDTDVTYLFNSETLFNKTEYDRLSAAWKAFGLSILLLPDLTLVQPNTENHIEVLSGIQDFKVWFLRTATRGIAVGSSGKWYLPYLDDTIVLIKKIGPWITYYGAFNLEREAPKTIQQFPGQGHKGYLTLSWLRGSLSRWSKPWLLKPTYESTYVLAQMSTFGRALPPPSGFYTETKGDATLLELCTEVKTPVHVLNAFKQGTYHVVNKICRMNGISELNRDTHISVSATGSEGLTLEQGGFAALAVHRFREMLHLPAGEVFDVFQLDDQMDYYDPTGRMCLHRTGVRMIRKFPDTQLLKVLYRGYPDLAYEDLAKRSVIGKITSEKRGIDPLSGTEYVYQHKVSITDIMALKPGLKFHDINDDFYTNGVPDHHILTGDMLLLCAFACSTLYGTYKNLEVNTFNSEFPYLPIWDHEPCPEELMWSQSRPVPATFICLPEPGFKPRPLTKNLWWVTVLQQALRHSVDAFLARDGRAGLGLNSAHVLWRVKGNLKSFNKDKVPYYGDNHPIGETWFVNCDLQDATNRIPHDLLRVMWAEFMDRLVPNGHPLYALKKFVLVDHELSYKRQLHPHRCGSFMGEPMSFPGLTLYNMVVCHLSTVMLNNGLRTLSEMRFEHLAYDTPIRSVDTIIGDDLMRITKYKALSDTTEQVYRESNAKTSIGKHTVSKYHAVLAETHMYYNYKGGYGYKKDFSTGSLTPYRAVSNSIQFLDVIKCRLLTQSTREHSDHRDSLIGKGGSLNQAIDWCNTPTHQPPLLLPKIQMASVNARRAYADSLHRFGISKEEIVRCLDLGAALPPAFGGCGLSGATITQMNESHPVLMGYWYHILLQNYTHTLMSVSSCASYTKPLKRGIPNKDPSYELQRLIGQVTVGCVFDLESFFGTNGFDHDEEKVIGKSFSWAVLEEYFVSNEEYFQSRESPLRIPYMNKWVNGKQVRSIRVKETVARLTRLQFFSSDYLVSRVERASVFNTILTSTEIKPHRLQWSSFKKRLQDLHTYITSGADYGTTDVWMNDNRVQALLKRDRDELKGLNLPYLRDWSALSWEIIQLQNTVIHRRSLKTLAPLLGPSLIINGRRKLPYRKVEEYTDSTLSDESYSYQTYEFLQGEVLSNERVDVPQDIQDSLGEIFSAWLRGKE